MEAFYFNLDGPIYKGYDMKFLVSALVLAVSMVFAAPATYAAGDGLTQKMNSLFPKPKADPSKREVPVAPVLSAPKAFSKVSGGKASLTWGEVAGASEYHVQVATDPNFKWLVNNDYHVKATNFETAALEAGKTYYWRVAAVKTSNWDTFRKSVFAHSTFVAE